MKHLFFDVETTNTDAKTGAIHQLAGIVEINGTIKETFNYRIRPHEDADINDESLAINGLNKTILSLYPIAPEQHRAFVSLLARYVNKYNKEDKFFLLGYNNNAFDNGFLRNFFELQGDNYFGSWFWNGSIDVMVMAANFLKANRHEMPNFQLRTVASKLGIHVEESRLHDALYDVELTRLIYHSVSSPIDATKLARQVLTTLDAQQKYFQAARSGSSVKNDALERSKKLEASLRTTCETLTLSPSQPTLF